MTYVPDNRIDDFDELLAAGTVASDKIFDRSSEDFRRSISKQLFDSAWTFGKDFQEQSEARIGSLEMWEKCEPRDAIEAMLVTQMIAIHHGALGWSHRAALETLSVESCERATNKAVQLAGVFQSQVATLDKHRGKGQQKITVERVMVESGANAIVGNVETSVPPAAAARKVKPAALVDGRASAALNASFLDEVPKSEIRVRSRTRSH